MWRVSKLNIFGSDNGLSPSRRNAIIWINAGMLLIRPIGNFSEILLEIHITSFKKMRLKWRLQNVKTKNNHTSCVSFLRFT